jgi:hypothetical protein
VYCWNQRLSQYTADNLAAIIRKKFPSSSVAVYGAVELAGFAEKFPDQFDKYYHAEIASITRVSTASTPAETKGLSLALAAFGSEDAKKLRSEVSITALLSIIKDNPSVPLDQIAGKISNELQLPDRLNVDYIQTIVTECLDEALIEERELAGP